MEVQMLIMMQHTLIYTHTTILYTHQRCKYGHCNFSRPHIVMDGRLYVAHIGDSLRIAKYTPATEKRRSTAISQMLHRKTITFMAMYSRKSRAHESIT